MEKTDCKGVGEGVVRKKGKNGGETMRGGACKITPKKISISFGPSLHDMFPFKAENKKP
jgi:hypothetical protein